MICAPVINLGAPSPGVASPPAGETPAAGQGSHAGKPGGPIPIAAVPAPTSVPPTVRTEETRKAESTKFELELNGILKTGFQSTNMAFVWTAFGVLVVAAFALLWALALHDKEAGDAPFLQGLRLIEAAAGDDRNFVKKAVHMALGAIGRRSPALHAASVSLARRLAASPDATRRWIGRDALRELTSPRIAGRFAKRVGARKAR